MSGYGMPLPRIVYASQRRTVRRRPPIFKCFLSLAQAVRKATPCGISPVLTIRQSAMSSLRARATIMVLRIAPASLIGHRSIPLGQSALLLEHEEPPSKLYHASPDAGIASPGETFSRRLLPLSSGRAGETGVASDRSLIPQVRDNISFTSMSAVSIPTPMTRASNRTIACDPSLGCFPTFVSGSLRSP